MKGLAAAVGCGLLNGSLMVPLWGHTLGAFDGYSQLSSGDIITAR